MFEYLKGLFISKEKEILDVEKVGENTIKYIETATHIRRIVYDINVKIIESIITKK